MASDGRKSTGFFVKCVTGMFVLAMTTIYYNNVHFVSPRNGMCYSVDVRVW